ncbi:MAG TPA: sigma-70 family RNA polymerase sigma factor [Synergistales bacterium]|nr:sigma-70 family RNA polymerase sigma factor [Synergistales bacterium]
MTGKATSAEKRDASLPQESAMVLPDTAGGSPEAMDEATLWRRCAEDHDEDARDSLIVSYRPLVFWLAKKFHVHPSSYQDLIQEGMLALIRAVDKFEPERHLKFTTYAFYRIKGQMINFLQRSEKKAPLPVDDEFLMPEDPFLPETFETMLALSEELRRLPAKEGEVLQAILMDGREAREVAQERGIDISHVYRLKRNALAKLRKWLGAEATNEV